VGISLSGIVGTVIGYNVANQDWDYALVAYDAEDDMDQVGGNEYLGEDDDQDIPTDILVDNGGIYVTGSSYSELGVETILTAKYNVGSVLTLSWSHYFGIPDTYCYGTHFAPQYSQAYGQRFALLPVVAGTVQDENGTDFLFIEYEATPQMDPGDQVKFWDTWDSDFWEEAYSAAAFSIPEPIDELAAGYYVYVSGTQLNSDGLGSNLLTQLWYRTINGTTWSPLWVDGAVWNNDVVDGNEFGGYVIVTSTDATADSNPRRTRALVTGYTTDGDGNKLYVTVKYDATERTSGNKPEKWAKIETPPDPNPPDDEDWPAPLGICHAYFAEPNDDPKVHFFLTGYSIIGLSAEDIWTVGFRENFEP
jgi:hypothetical protein